MRSLFLGLVLALAGCGGFLPPDVNATPSPPLDIPPTAAPSSDLATPIAVPSPTTAPTGVPIPVAIEVGKKADLSDSEVAFTATNVKIAAIQLFGTKFGKQYEYPCIEQSVYANAARLKAMNPQIKVLIYWGFAGNGHMEYCAYNDPRYVANQKAWYVQEPGQKQAFLDISRQDVRDWWTDMVAGMVSAGKLDGFFCDGLRDTKNDKLLKYKLLMFAELQQKLAALNTGQKLIVANGDATYFVSSGLSKYIDQVMIEWWDLVYYPHPSGTPVPRTPDQDLAYLKAAWAVEQTASTNPNVAVWLKAWPYPHDFLDPTWNAETYATQATQAKQALAFQLACFLTIYSPTNSYIYYSGGYDANGLWDVLETDSNGNLPTDLSKWTVDPTWYLLLYGNPMGIPLGPPTFNGYVVSRPYSRGILTVNLQTRVFSGF